MDSNVVITGTGTGAVTKDSGTPTPYSVNFDGDIYYTAYVMPKAGSSGNPTAVPKSFVELTNAICFRLHQFTTADLLKFGIQFITVLLFASIILPFSLFQILLFILIILLAIIYIVGKSAFNVDKANAPVDKQRLAEFRSRRASLDGLKHRKPTTAETAAAAPTAAGTSTELPTVH